jgi:hypothetical protein
MNEDEDVVWVFGVLLKKTENKGTTPGSEQEGKRITTITRKKQEEQKRGRWI